MKLALAQTSPLWMDTAANMRRAESLIAQAAEGRPDLIAFPEMALTGYEVDAAAFAEPENGPISRWLSSQADLHGIAIVLGAATNAGQLHNSVLLARPGSGVRRIYDKVHPFSYANENKFIEPGVLHEGCEIAGMRVRFAVCYDLRFPELFTSRARDTELFIVPASWPARRQAHWDLLLRARALDTLTYVAGVNRTGEGGGLAYTGGSAVYSPWGETVALAGTEEELLLADIESAKVHEVRGTFSLLEDRRVEFYRRLDMPLRTQ